MTNQWSFEEEKRSQAALLCYPEGYPNRRSSWTLEEHTLFLLGVQKYGWGHWNNVSNSAVMTRDATQVASHGQKFYIRQKEREPREHARASIHDITLANSNPGHLNHLLSSRPHLVLHSRSMMQQSHQAALPIHHDIQLNQLSTQMNQESPHISSCVQLQNPNYQPIHHDLQLNQLSTQMDQVVPHISSCVQLQNPHYQPNSQVVDQSLPWKHGDQSENPNELIHFPITVCTTKLMELINPLSLLYITFLKYC
ncbi:hypothetical protein K1719_042781 [Acacia pycnantha]|nr:hypothetical protein K1719_042781 [Acacia pycnantha]